MDLIDWEWDVKMNTFGKHQRKEMENNEQNLLREIANDRQTPKNRRNQNTDGLFETTDLEDETTTETVTLID